MGYIANFDKTSPESRDHFENNRQATDERKKKILIVEDDEPIIMLLVNLLSNEGTVEIAHDGREGLNKTNSSFFDVIISDIEMPVMDGINFFKMASTADETIRERFIFLPDPHQKNILIS